MATALSAPRQLAQDPTKTNDQYLVDQTLAPKIEDNIIFASNIGGIGKEVDSDDLNVVNNGKTHPEVNKAGDHFEVELPLLDASHKSLDALSPVYPCKAGDDNVALAKHAKNMRNQLSRKIPNLAQPWQVDPAIVTRTYAQHLVDQTMASHMATHPRLWLSATS